MRRATKGTTPRRKGNKIFLSTLSLRRATWHSSAANSSLSHFYPRSPCGERRWRFAACCPYTHFYPRSPCGERPAIALEFDTTPQFLSTLSLRRATVISRSIFPQRKFLSTLSLRRATRWRFAACCPYTHFYPRSPCGERRPTGLCRYPDLHFYPRSPCGERPYAPTLLHAAELFLSTLSLRRATDQADIRRIKAQISIHALLAESDFPCVINKKLTGISIHALLAESDRSASCTFPSWKNFYPRSPCGERRKSRSSRSFLPLFLSTLSLRRATKQSKPPA